MLNSKGTKEKNAFKKESRNECLNRWTEKVMYIQSVSEMPKDVDKKNTWEWMKSIDLKIETEALIFAQPGQKKR